MWTHIKSVVPLAGFPRAAGAAFTAMGSRYAWEYIAPCARESAREFRVGDLDLENSSPSTKPFGLLDDAGNFVSTREVCR